MAVVHAMFQKSKETIPPGVVWQRNQRKGEKNRTPSTLGSILIWIASVGRGLHVDLYEPHQGESQISQVTHVLHDAKLLLHVLVDGLCHPACFVALGPFHVLG